MTKQGVFEMVMHWKQFPYLEHSQDLFKLDAVRVREVLNRPVITVSSRERVLELIALLRESTHNGFPVVDR
jgi:CBS domain-containing protein